MAAFLPDQPRVEVNLGLLQVQVDLGHQTAQRLFRPVRQPPSTFSISGLFSPLRHFLR